MRILVACEFSGIVRDAFRERGHDAISCDLIGSERPGPHIVGDVRQVVQDGWDMMLAFPPCTYLCRSGQWRWGGTQEMWLAVGFCIELMESPIERIALENPVGVLSTYYRRPNQIVQPWQFGHGETKATCLWHKNLPRLQPTHVIDERIPYLANMPQRKSRQKARQRTYTGIAQAMARQWG